jgi:ankyrin repeat protein
MVTQELVDAIFRATRSGDTEAAGRMLDEVPQLLSLEREGRGLLLEAAYGGHVGLVRLLVERGAGLETSDMFGNTPLRVAAAGGHEELVSILLHSGADITRSSEQGWTALSSASIYGHLLIIRLLLQHIRGRGLDARDEDGRTALWYACTRDHPEIARTLLLAGADHTIPNHTGSLGRQVAEAYGYQAAVALLDVGPVSGDCIAWPVCL